VAEGLIQALSTPQLTLAPFQWQEGLVALTQDPGQGKAGLSAMKVYRSMAITAAPDCEGVVLLLNRRRRPGLALENALAVNLSSVVAIALHQHYLQQQSQQCNEQLRYLNYLKEDFLSTLNHELRTPLTSMMLAIRMLRRSDLTPERQAMYQESLATAQLSMVVNVPQSAVRVLASASHLTRAMRELMTNACKYSAPGSTITLSLAQPMATDAQATVQISNVGAGIQADELPHVFEKFRRGRNATKDAIPGTGTGLALVRGLMEQIDGTITVTSHPLGDQLWQTCFSLGFRRHQPAA
jgi:signal transduction histidine kinase